MSAFFANITGWVACVDIGATKVAVSLANANGFQTKNKVPTAKTGTQHALADQIIRMVHQGCEQAGIQSTELRTIGVASCGPFVIQHGMIELAAPNICGGIAGEKRGLPNTWHSAVLEAPLRQAFAGSHIRIGNDAVAAL